MNKLILLTVLLVPLCFFSQQINVIPGSHTLSLTLKLNSQGQSNPNGVINSLNSLTNIKQVSYVTPTELRVDLLIENQKLPGQAFSSLTTAVNQFVSNIYFSNNEQVLDIFKAEKVSFKSVMVSGLSTKTDALSLIQSLLNDKHVLFVNPNFETYELFVIYENRISDDDFSAIIKTAGKNIISSSEEISKYY